jgi:hypothetical protein
MPLFARIDWLWAFNVGALLLAGSLALRHTLKL